MKKNMKYKIISVISFSVFILIWELATDVFHLMPSYSLPSPIHVAQTFIYKLYNKNPDGSILIVHIFSSLQVALVGFFFGAVLGVPIGICMGWFKKFDMFFKPIFDLLRPIPPVGWIPIMILFFGIGIEAKAAVIFLASFISCVINTYSGIKQVNPVHLWVAQTFGATNTQMLIKVAIPTAMPMIFTGLRVSMGAAWLSLVAAELVAATQGLGYMIQIARMLGRADIIVVGMLTIGIVGTILSTILEFFEKKFVKGGI